MISKDDEAKDALKWASKEDFPWPTIEMKSQKAFFADGSSLGAELDAFPVPGYLLVSKDGEILAKAPSAEEKSQLFEKAGLK